MKNFLKIFLKKFHSPIFKHSTRLNSLFLDETALKFGQMKYVLNLIKIATNKISKYVYTIFRHF